MASGSYVWGIDIGKCALKALRCRVSAEPRKLEAVACEYIEYPMILSQPEADPIELVQSALEQLISRHDLKGDKVAVSVPGSLGLSKFIKLPPIESKKIPDIVKYEARQQIPFPLEQVVWRWQRLAGGMEESGFVLDAEVALFAMKREQVFKALAPLQQAGIHVDFLQLAPIALANMAIFDQLPDSATTDPDTPIPSIALVSVGVDSTDLVVTNGRRIWQRSIQSGGSDFTKSLVQGMKLTFSRAENLKRNAVKAEDPKAVFKTMKPVFNEFASELQRSLNYFTGTDRTATIAKVLLMGNATKLRGLADFVGQQLQLEVQRLDKFNALEGAAVLSTPAFKEHQLAFGTAYGLALQAANVAAIGTNLLPDEIVRDRIIESKKPWAVGALVGLLAAAMINFFGMFAAWTAYAPDLYAAAFGKADTVKKQSAAATAAIGQVRERQTAAIAQQQWLARVQNQRFEALDMMRSVQSLLPRDEEGKIPENPADRKELHIDQMDCQYFPDLAVGRHPHRGGGSRRTGCSGGRQRRAASAGPAAGRRSGRRCAGCRSGRLRGRPGGEERRRRRPHWCWLGHRVAWLSLPQRTASQAVGRRAIPAFNARQESDGQGYQGHCFCRSVGGRAVECVRSGNRLSDHC